MNDALMVYSRNPEWFFFVVLLLKVPDFKQ